MKILFICLGCFGFTIASCGQQNSKTKAYAVVDFNAQIRPWDGFGFNYVQTSQTFDFKTNPQDYGGFSILKEKDKEEILELIFGQEGLKVNILKMFLDPFHQIVEGGPYDHVTTTRHMVEFAKRGVMHTRKRGSDISVISTMYSPPGYMTKQKIIRGRDLDPAHTRNLCEYYAHWAEYLLHQENLPLRYISLHNEGEDWGRWPADGSVEETHKDGHDYNFFWSPEQTTSILKQLRPLFDKRGLSNVGLTNGEYTNWYRFNAWGFARALEEDTLALKQISLITSHGFYVGSMTSGHWFGPHSSSGTDRLRAIRPELHAWTTSTAWNAFTQAPPRIYYMDEQFIKEIHGSILDAKVNAIIPWAGIQRASQWNKPDPNPGCAIRVFDDGTWEIQKGYYYYKQVSRAGQSGMAVADSFVMSSELSVMAFASNGTKNPNSMVVINQSEEPREIAINLKGHKAMKFAAFRTSGRQDYKLKSTAEYDFLKGDNYKSLGDHPVHNSAINYQAPPHSVTTFFEVTP